MSALAREYDAPQYAAAQRQIDRQDRAEHGRELAHRHLAALLTEAVRSGSDIKLPRPGDRSVKLYPVSEYLGDGLLAEHRALLFKACGEALRGESTGTLREFVEAVAASYADDYADEMAEGERQ